MIARRSVRLYILVVALAAMLLIAATFLLLRGGESAAVDRKTTGDPRAGLSVFKFEGCAACHVIANVSTSIEGGVVGPDLDGEGNRRGAPWLRAMLPAHIRTQQSPTGAMKPLSARDAEDLVSYLISLR